MAQNYLITGYWGEPHVTAENDRGINAAIFGSGRFVLPVGEMFRAEYIGNNTIRMYDGKLLDNGAAAGIPAGEYIDFTIPETGQGATRNDLIVFQYSKDLSALVESGSFVVVSGTETTEAASDPELTQNDLLNDEVTVDQMALWRIPVSGATIGTPEQVFNTRFAGERIATAHSSDGENYTATFPGICHLYNGLEITIVPDKNNAKTTIKLDLNGLGDKTVRRPLSSSTFVANAPETNFLRAGVPCRLMYHASYAGGGIWLMAEKQKTSAQDLYGSVPVQSGGIATDSNTTDEDIATANARLLSILGDSYIKSEKIGAENGVAPLNSSKRIDQSYTTFRIVGCSRSSGSTSGSSLISFDNGGFTPEYVRNLVRGGVYVVLNFRDAGATSNDALLVPSAVYDSGDVEFHGIVVKKMIRILLKSNGQQVYSNESISTTT